MITRCTAWWQRVRRAISRSEWSVRWLRLPRTKCVSTDHGLIMLQIDGLSKIQLERAIENGRMPFLKRLIAREHYQLHSLYSGLPSSTPSVQGELFYGPRCTVPAFGFRDHRSGQLVRMFSRDVARRVQERLEEQGPGILAEGSAYCNIYDGGAAETHFCATSLGWDEVIQSANPLKVAGILLWHGWSFVRTLGLLVIECVLAVGGFFRGILSGRELWQELMMIPARVVVVILMRELATIGVALDVARGLPVIHVNFLGYDEQAHRRGPDSAFAHWTLKGIDGAIRRLWASAHRSGRRQYDVWVYSDHGQEITTPYEYVAGKSIRHVVAEVVDGCCQTPPLNSVHEKTTTNRAHWLGAGRIVGMLFGEDLIDNQQATGGVQVQAVGPLGLVYTNKPCSLQQREFIARRLVRERQIPLAVVATTATSAIAITPEGRYQLPEESRRVFGNDHPFANELARDMVQLCHHPDAGDLVISGWNSAGPSYSFVLQHGAHAGPGPQETGAFALLPCDTSLPETPHGFLRPTDLREAALRFLKPIPFEATRRATIRSHVTLGRRQLREGRQPLRVMTYNVHACVGMDGQLSPRRIARVIAQSDADIVALQELDVFRLRTGHRDQALDIARHLEMHYHFHPAWQLEEEKYGDAVLSRYPLRIIKSDQLPASQDHREPRGAIWVEIALPDAPIQFLNTHLSIFPSERFVQSQELASAWIDTATQVGPTILCGDFNALPGAPVYRLLAERLHDVQITNGPSKAAPTWFSPRPLARIDHIFTTSHFQVMGSGVIQSRLARVASDHVPLIADISLTRI